jgi:hypothetical protein
LLETNRIAGDAGRRPSVVFLNAQLRGLGEPLREERDRAPQGRGARSHGRDRSAFAYKDIEAVMAASTSLVRPTRRLTPLGVVKG